MLPSLRRSSDRAAPAGARPVRSLCRPAMRRHRRHRCCKRAAAACNTRWRVSWRCGSSLFGPPCPGLEVQVLIVVTEIGERRDGLQGHPRDVTACVECEGDVRGLDGFIVEARDETVVLPVLEA